jgi:hypothetical protein
MQRIAQRDGFTELSPDTSPLREFRSMPNFGEQGKACQASFVKLLDQISDTRRPTDINEFDPCQLAFILSKSSQLTSVQQRRPIFGNYPLRRNPIRIVPHKHIGEVCPVVDSFSRCLSSFKARQRLENRLKLGLVEVGKRIALTGIEPDFVGR